MWSLAYDRFESPPHSVNPGYGRMTAYGPKVRPTIVNSGRPEKRRSPCSAVAINRVAGVAKGAKSGAIYRTFGRWFYSMIGAFGPP
jgi:hypothetical protein